MGDMGDLSLKKKFGGEIKTLNFFSVHEKLFIKAYHPYHPPPLPLFKYFDTLNVIFNDIYLVYI